MADNQAEQKQAAQPKEGEKPKGPTTLDRVVNDIWNGIFNPAIAAGAIGASAALFGIDGLAVAASFPAGRAVVEYAKADGKGQFTTAKLRDEAIAGALFTPLVWHGINATKQIPKAFGLDGLVTNILGYSVPLSPLVVGGVTAGILTPLVTAIYYPLSYLIEHKTFKGIGEDFKKNYMKGLIRTAPLTVLTSAAVGAAYAMPFLAPYLFPFLAITNIAYRILLSPEKLSIWKLAISPIYAPIYGAYYLARGAVGAAVSTVKGLASLVYKAYTALHDIGSEFGRPFATAPAR